MWAGIRYLQISGITTGAVLVLEIQARHAWKVLYNFKAAAECKGRGMRQYTVCITPYAIRRFLYFALLIKGQIIYKI